ncbi:ferritin-like domain-containing protein [Flavobacterium sp. ST-75]|uniref:Ferritin-like domain-containing protein n=1 Tax=Flavobacterium rhizophilum TaxID=3163296 RepID=A0ABW8YAY8_9FLAO
MKKVKVEEVKSNLTNRRSFLKISGLAIAGTGLVIAGCSNDDDGGMTPPPEDNQLPGVRNGVFDLGGGDAGILTYAYALEQLEADFYTRVVNGNNFGSVFSSEEQSVLTDLYRHEVVHREFFKAALTGALNDPDRVLPDLNFDYGDLNFSNRLQVLNTAKTLEDTGVAAYNGAGRYITTPDYLVIAGKIVSVEARHASAIRSLLNPGSADFAGDDVIDVNGLDLAQMPSEILAAVGSLGVVQTPFTAQFLP